MGKRILPEVAQQVLQAVLAQPADAWPQLLSVIQTQAAGRHVQIFLHDAAAEKALAAAGYDGAILSPPVDDYLMVVDANVGATKGDWYTHKQLNLYTEVYPGGMSRHQLRLSYDLPPPVDDADRLLNPGDGAYLDYVRVYLPEQASIAGFNLLLDGKPTAGGPDRVDVEHGKKVVGAFFNLPRGHRVELDLTYEVPLAKGSRYSFQIQKQAGVLDLPTTLAFSWPGGRETRRLDLVRDLELTYRW